MLSVVIALSILTDFNKICRQKQTKKTSQLLELLCVEKLNNLCKIATANSYLFMPSCKFSMKCNALLFFFPRKSSLLLYQPVCSVTQRCGETGVAMAD